MPICQKCHKHRQRSSFGLRPDLAEGIDRRCKICINEAVKLSIRSKKLKGYAAELKNWPIEKVISERGWLANKLEMLVKEADRRESK